MANLKVIRDKLEARLKAEADKAAKKKAADIEKDIRNFYKEFPTPGREMDKETPLFSYTNEPRRPKKKPAKRKPKKSDYI